MALPVLNCPHLSANFPAMSTEKTDGELLTPAQVAKMLGVSVRTLKYWRRLRTVGPMPFVRLGRRSIRYRKTAVEAFINQQTINGETNGP